jgi:GDP-L-fucose synthase
MNILITGCNGFIGRNLVQYFKQEHNVFACGRKQLDLLDRMAVDRFFKENNIDIVLHTAVVGGNRVDNDTFQTVVDNLTMFDNLYNNRDRFGKMISFGSGAEFDRSKMTCELRETDFLSNVPSDFYGLVKNIIARRIRDTNKNIYNLRLFGCFGCDEPDHRFIRSAIKCILNGVPITIHDDIRMDFFYVQDVCRVVEHHIYNEVPSREVNLVYADKTKLSDVVAIIFDETGKKVDVSIEQNSSRCYNGNGDLLQNLGVQMTGLREGIREVYEREIRENT